MDSELLLALKVKSTMSLPSQEALNLRDFAADSRTVTFGLSELPVTLDSWVQDISDGKLTRQLKYVHPDSEELHAICRLMSLSVLRIRIR
jgi:hypothetical protein